jgi:hypothetical protein
VITLLPNTWYRSLLYSLWHTPWRKTLIASSLGLLLLSVSYFHSKRHEDRLIIPINRSLWSVTRIQGGQCTILLATTRGPERLEYGSYKRQSTIMDFGSFSYSHLSPTNTNWYGAGPGHVVEMRAAHWVLAAIASLFVAACHVRGYLYLRAIRSKGCPICCYDLTGNVSGVCPECGTPISNLLLHKQLSSKSPYQ